MYWSLGRWKFLLVCYLVTVSFLWHIGMKAENFGFLWLALAWCLSEFGAKGVCDGLRETWERERGLDG